MVAVEEQRTGKIVKNPSLPLIKLPVKGTWADVVQEAEAASPLTGRKL
jgi:hypothetical protein